MHQWLNAQSLGPHLRALELACSWVSPSCFSCCPTPASHHRYLPAPPSLAPQPPNITFHTKPLNNQPGQPSLFPVRLSSWELPTPTAEGQVTTFPFWSFAENVIFQLRRTTRQGQKQTRGHRQSTFSPNSTAVESETKVPIPHHPQEQIIQAINTEIHFYFLSGMHFGANI